MIAERHLVLSALGFLQHPLPRPGQGRCEDGGKFFIGITASLVIRHRCIGGTSVWPMTGRRFGRKFGGGKHYRVDLE
jgi:hypothetical protein